MLVSDAIVTVRERLFDPGRGAGWSDAEIIDYLNRAQQRIVFLKPDAYPRHENVALVLGTLQSIPAGGVALLEIVKNFSSGRIVEQVDYDLLKASNWSWPAGTAAASIECYAADPRDPTRFLVSPPAAAGCIVEIVWGATPPALTASTDNTVLLDSYNPTLIDGVLAMAYGKPSVRQDPAKATYHQQLFDSALGVKTKSQFAIAPKVSQSPGQ